MPRALIHISVAAVVTIVSVLGAEYVVRRLSDPDTRYIRAMRRPHAELGWSLTPDVSFLHQSPEANVVMRYNRGGWRDVEHAIENPDGRFRIAVLGDSFMEAYSVALVENFPRQLRRELSVDPGDNEVLNFGVSGYSTFQEYLTYIQEVRKYGPDLVLVGFFVANDINGNSMELERSVHTGVHKLLSRPFLSPDGSWEVTQVDPDLARDVFEALLSRSIVHRWRIARHSILARHILRRYARVSGRLSGHRPAPVVTPSNFEPTGDLSYHVVHACEENDAVTRAWATTSLILARLRDTVRSDGAELVVFNVPAWEEVDPEQLRLVTERDAELNRLCLEESPGHLRLMEMLDDLDIPAIDLLPAFRARMRAPGVNLFGSDEHWNATGHGLAAAAVAGELRKRGLLGNGTRAGHPLP